MSTDVVVVPATGEVVDLADAGAVARAYNEIRDLERQLREARDVLTEALLAQSKHLGSKTLHTAGGKVVVKGGTETTYAAEEIERELREAGMPEDRIRDIVTETVTYAVVASAAKRAAAANPVYAEIIARHSVRRPKKAYVSVGLPGGSS